MKPYSIGPLCGLLKPKYRSISMILGEDYSPDVGLDIFLDLNTVISAMSTSQKYLASLPFSAGAEKDIIENVLKLYKHWKDYTRKWEDKVRIFMVYNDFEMGDIPERKQLHAYLVPYENKFKHDRFSQLTYYWNEAMNIIEPLMDYIPMGYMIKCKDVDSFIIPSIINDDCKRDRLIVSGSAMMTNHMFDENTKVIHASYRRIGMLHISEPSLIIHTLTKIDEEIVDVFTRNKVFYNMLSTITGDKDRGIIGITQFGITVFANDLLRAIEKREVPAEPKSIDTVLSVVDEMYHDYLKKHYPLMDVDIHKQMIPPSTIEKIRSKLIDKSDLDALMKYTINDLNLMELV